MIRQVLRVINDPNAEQNDDVDEFEIDNTFTSEDTTDEEWSNYAKYLEKLLSYLRNAIMLPNLTPEMRSLFLRKAFRCALIEINLAPSKRKLKNLWDRLDFPKPMEAVSKYVRKINEFGNDELDKIWKRYVINEKYERSIFNNIDRLKLVNTAINSLIVTQRLIYKDHLKAFFPLHNENELFGDIRIKEPLID